MSYVNLMASDVWTEADIVNRGRSIINEKVSEIRQNELRTSLLGHIAGMRPANPNELAEISLVQQTTESVVISNQASRSDMILLREVMSAEMGEITPEELSDSARNLFELRQNRVSDVQL